MRSLAPLLVLFAFGCEAIFTNLSPEGGPPADVGLAMDATADSGRDPVDVGPATPVLLGSGSFEGRGGYPASGSVRLEQLSPGEYQVVMSDDFSSAAVPGPVVVITQRTDIGLMLGSDELVVTSLSAEQVAGAGTYMFRAPSPPDDAYIFIYCEPFGVETARAQLVAP